MNNKYLGFALGVSIILNAFLLGMNTTHVLRGAPFGGDRMGGGMPPPMEEMILNRVQEQSGKISTDGQSKITTIVEKYKPLLRKGDMDKVHNVFDDIQKAMTAEKFDKAKIKKLHQEINSADIKSKEAIGNMMEEIASNLTDADRIAFFQGMFPPHDRDGPHGDEHGEPPFPPDHDKFKK